MLSFTDILNIPIHKLAQQKMRPVKVAVLDTGIDASHKALRGKVFQAIGYRRNKDGNIESLPLCRTVNNDPSGHGTGVASIISTLAPNAKFIDYRVLDTNNCGYGSTVIKGLEEAIDSDAEIINISVTYRKDRYWEQTAQLLEKAYLANKIVIASKRNIPMPGDLGLPAELSNAISVDIGEYRNPFIFRFLHNSAIEFSAHGVEILTAKTGGGYIRLTGTSFATPIITAFCTLLRGVNHDLKLFEIKSILRHSANVSQKKEYSHIANPLECTSEIYDGHYQQVKYKCRCGHTFEVPDAFPNFHCIHCDRIVRRRVLLNPTLYCHILDILRESMPAEFCFHNWEHTREVVESVYKILSKFPKLSVRRKRCLLTAALMHDIGYLTDPSNHEVEGAKQARLICESLKFSKEDIDLIASIIMATQLKYKPVTLEEKIIKDADLYHLKSPRLQKIKSALLRKELENFGKIYTDAEWQELDQTFRRTHKFYIV